MSKKYLKPIGITLGIFLLVLLVGSFGLNFWLKNSLPGYLKKNTHYIVNYKTLDVELATGNISATGISVNNKNPNNHNVIGLQGSVDTLKISRFGIYEALVKKTISSNDLLLVNPHLSITLAKPIDDKTGKKRNPVTFENIRIKDGNIQIFRHTKQKYIAVNNLMLNVENLQMTEEDVENKLPVVFDRYDIQGDRFYFRPDNVYEIFAAKISTKDGLMDIINFQLKPLMSHAQFIKAYPEKINMFDFQAKEMKFKDIILNNKKLSLSNVTFNSPDLKMFTTGAKLQQKQKSFTYEVNFDDVALNNAKVSILKPGGSKLFSAEDLDLSISRLFMDENSAKGNIPFSYEKFKIIGKGLNYISDNQNMMVASLALNQRSGDLRGLSIRPIGSNPTKSQMDFSAKRARFTVKDWNLENNKLKLNADQLVLEGIDGNISAAKNPQKKKANYSGLQFPLTVKNISIKNSNLSYNIGDKGITLKNLNLNVAALEMNEETVKNGIPFKTGNYSLTTSHLLYRISPFYNLSASLLKFNKNQLTVNGFAVKPLVSRAQFIRMIPSERDLYDIKTSQITVNGEWDLLSEKKFFNASSVSVSGMHAIIFRSKLPKDDLSDKPMYSELLRKIKFPLRIADLNIKNSLLEYEEDTKQSVGAGKLSFGRFNLNAKNINSDKPAGQPTMIPITIHCAFMNASPMNVKWNIDTASMTDAFTISGNIADMPVARINPFIEPYLKVRAEGLIRDLIFNFKGNKSGLNGTFNLKHENLKVSILKETGEENTLLSAVANLFVRTDSEKFPESVTVDNVKRDPTKSFFNLFWQGVQEGLKKTLISENIEKTEKTVKNTVKDAKEATKMVKETVNEVKKEMKSDPNPKSSEKKGGLFNRIFKKKEKAKN